jgi:hypothetical protein
VSDVILSMSDQELVARGYLVIRRFGTTTQYIPTAKYRATMMLPPLTTLTLHGQEGEFVYEPGEAYYICGECGENLYPRCGCLPLGQLLLLPASSEEDMRPKAPTEVLINAQRPIITTDPAASGRYSLIAADVEDGELISYDPSLHVETVTFKVGKK